MANQLTPHESQVDNYLEPISDRERFCIDKATQAINNAFKEYQNEERQDRLKALEEFKKQSFVHARNINDYSSIIATTNVDATKVTSRTKKKPTTRVPMPRETTALKEMPTTKQKKKPTRKPKAAAAASTAATQKPSGGTSYKPSQLAKGPAKNEHGQSIARVEKGRDEYANNPNNKPAQINQEKADNNLLFSQKLATCCNKSNIPMNYETYDNEQTNGNGNWGGFGVPDAALRPIAKSKLFDCKDGTQKAEHHLITAVKNSYFLELPSTTDGQGMLIRHFAHRQFIKGRDDLLRMMTRKKNGITITDIVLTNASGENLLGAKNKHEIYRCIHGEDGTKAWKKTAAMNVISDALANIAFNTVKVKGLIVNNTQIYVRRPIKTYDALGLTEAGRSVFDYNAKGKRLESDSDSDLSVEDVPAKAAPKKRKADKIAAKPAVEPTKAKNKKKADKPTTKPPAVKPVHVTPEMAAEMAAKLKAAVAATSSDGKVGTKELAEASAFGYSKAYIIALAADAAKKNT